MVFSYLWKRDKRPDFSMQPFNHWINSSKVASSKSQSVSIIALLQGVSFADDFSREQNRNLVRSSPSSVAKNSGVHREHAHCKAAPLNTAGSVRFKSWVRSFAGLESSEILSTLQWSGLFTSNPHSSAMLEWRQVTVIPLYNRTMELYKTGRANDVGKAGVGSGRAPLCNITHIVSRFFLQAVMFWTTAHCHDENYLFYFIRNKHVFIPEGFQVFESFFGYNTRDSSQKAISFSIQNTWSLP